ncbi:hypothetical protein [Pelagibius marinus]|uniref:hypothetical protein n=1 Tax=Pelagibius marinus TaxID=2762760 RepID=UPI001872CDE2|nr:hypothetical protein [Pelagibius marinus]
MKYSREWPGFCRTCGKWGCAGALAGSLVAAGWAYATCKGGRCDAGELGRIPMPQFTVTSTSSAAPSDSVTIHNNVTDEEVEFVVLNAKTYQHYDLEALASATMTPRIIRST